MEDYQLKEPLNDYFSDRLLKEGIEGVPSAILKNHSVTGVRTIIFISPAVSIIHYLFTYQTLLFLL